MNLASEGGDPNSSLLFVNFNQDCSSLAVGTKTGYKLFSLSTVDKLDLIYDNDTDEISIVERLFSSSLVAIVSLSSPRKLKVCHFKKGTEICNYSYSNTILSVRLNRLRLIVCLEESLYIHNIRDMKVLHTIRDTPPNPSGLCSLSVNNDNCFLAYPGSQHTGEVQIFDTVNLRAVTMIPAHDNPLAAMNFNSTGTRLATASEKGTVIRVFSVPEGQKLFEFRRGVKRCVNISSLAFSPDSLYLCASSNTETVHIFKLEYLKERPTEDSQSWMGYFGQALKSSATYLPTQVSDMLNQGRAFATAHLPFCGLKNVCALAVIQKLPRLVVACQDGYLYIYNVDPVEGGECPLLKQHRLDGCEDNKPVAEPVSSDKPLTSATPGTYAATTRTVSEANNMQAAPPGKRPVGPNVAHLSSGANGQFSYANVVRLATGQDREETAESEGMLGDEGGGSRAHKGFTDITDSWDVPESQAYQDIDPGAAGSEAAVPSVEHLRLDDDSEFPPMTHKND